MHYQDRFAPGEECYTCHANYGVHGTFQAKLLGLNDAWRELTGTYTVPIKMRKPFPNALCLKCHNGARKFMKEDSHLDPGNVVSKDILTDKTLCTDCHVPGHMLPKPRQKRGQGRLTMASIADIVRGDWPARLLWTAQVLHRSCRAVSVSPR